MKFIHFKGASAWEFALGRFWLKIWFPRSWFIYRVISAGIEPKEEGAE
jgi:hypothetical protein